MSKYIDREALLAELQEEIDFETPMYTEEQNKYFTMGLRCAYRDVKSQPIGDVIEVVRCKDCKHCYHRTIPNNERYECEYYGCSDEVVDYVEPTHYCSYGERREDNE